MKKNTLIILSVFGFAFGFSQKQASEKTFSFKIDGTIRNFSGNMIYVHHKWDEKEFTDSAKVVKGKFAFNLKSVDPNMYWFTIINNLNCAGQCYLFLPMQLLLKLI